MSTNCVTLKLTVGDPSGSESERWNLDIFEEATGKAVYHHCDQNFGTPGSTNYALVKGKAYTFSLKWVATNLGNYPDYDWQALINDSDEAGAREGLYGTGAFIVEDQDSLLTEYTDGGPNNLTIGKEGRIIVPRIKLEPITCGTVGAGVIVNPSGVAAGGLAVYRVEVEPEDAVADEDIHWSVAHGGVTFYSGHNTGREAIIRGGAVESDFKLEVRIGDVPETGCPYIHGRVLQPTVTPIHVYIICSNGVPAVSVDTVNAWVTEANRIYTQAAMSFYMAGVEYVASNDWFSINSSAEFHQMCSYASGTGGLELYCVDYMSSPGRHVGAPFCGMAVRGDANLNTLAHEIGHACGLGDIVDSPAGTAVSEALSGALNWSGGEGAGYYDPTLMHDALVRRLLMFYTANPQKADISRADVKGRVPDPYVPYEIFIRTGLLNMNRNPRH